MLTTWSVIGAIVGGLIPALLWLTFWLTEDRKHPEPKWLIGKTFFLGMVAVIAVYPFQKLVNGNFPGMGVAAFFLWSVLEEMFKFIAAYFGGLKTSDDNEPIDPMIYMITAALGFVALENTLYVLSPLIDLNIKDGLLMSNLRFIGASLLHTVASATIGLTLAISFYMRRRLKVLWASAGFLIAIFIHTIFNLYIRQHNNLNTFIAFSIVWLGIGVLLWFFELVKKIRPLPTAKPSLK